MGRLACVLALAASAAAGAEPASPLRLAPGSFAAAPPGLQDRLREDPLAYFRFVNAAWAARVCEAFRDDLPSMPTAILHGDAHVEQYAMTTVARGLDDFDDATRGPAVVDLVRFLGSLHLVAHQRGWDAARERLLDRFFDGYTRALADPAYLPPDPTVVTRLRARPRRTKDGFLAWGESLMRAPSDRDTENWGRSLALLEGFVRTLRPEIPPGYFEVRRMGWLQMGVGSALARKILARLQGPSPSPSDDVLIEAKELGRTEGVPCVEDPVSGEAFRIIRAAEQIGRIRHDILVIAPRREDQGPGVRDWWVRSWDETYVEVEVADLASADELAELAHDAGAQLGATGLRESSPAVESQMRHAEISGLRRREPRIRATARRLVEDLLAGWEELRAAR